MVEKKQKVNHRMEKVITGGKVFYSRVIKDDIFSLGAQLAYSFLFAFFPFLIVLMTLLGLSSIKSQDVLVGLRNLIPYEAYKLVYKTVVEVVDGKHIQLMSVGLLITIWSASNGFLAVIRGLNKAYEENEGRPFWKVELIAIASTFLLAIIIVVSIVLLVFGEVNLKMMAAYAGIDGSVRDFWNVFRYVAATIIMILIFAALYHYTPSRRLNWKEVLPGAIFTSIGWIVSSVIFSYYINNFTNYSLIYGSIGAVIIFMTWLFIISIILLIGGEINAVTTKNSHQFNKL